MPDYIRYGLICLILFITHFQEGITGFGCTVLALPFIVMLIGIQTAVPMLVILAWLIAIGIVLISTKEIIWKEYWRIIILAAIGLPVGMWMSKAMPETTLKWVLAIFMIAIGIQGLIRQGIKYKAHEEMSTTKRWLLSLFVPMGGMIHGAFGSGGPLVVIYAARALPNKSVFRVTLCLVWITINSMLISRWVINHSITPEILRLVAMCIPFTLAGMLLGNIAHHRVNDLVFRRIVYSVLAVSGIVLVWSLIRG